MLDYWTIHLAKLLILLHSESFCQICMWVHDVGLWCVCVFFFNEELEESSVLMVKILLGKIAFILRNFDCGYFE